MKPTSSPFRRYFVSGHEVDRCRLDLARRSGAPTKHRGCGKPPSFTEQFRFSMCSILYSRRCSVAMFIRYRMIFLKLWKKNHHIEFLELTFATSLTYFHLPIYSELFLCWTIIGRISKLNGMLFSVNHCDNGVRARWSRGALLLFLWRHTEYDDNYIHDDHDDGHVYLSTQLYSVHLIRHDDGLSQATQFLRKLRFGGFPLSLRDKRVRLVPIFPFQRWKSRGYR